MEPSTLRLLDANANRAREGLRTAEDFVRFSFGDVFWARRLRTFRHEITSTCLKHFPDTEFIHARRVASDCGSATNAPQVEQKVSKSSAHDVAVRGLKRAQEAVRVLEEYSRGQYPAAAQAFSEIRFRIYEAEAWLLAGYPSTQRLMGSKLYVLITEALCKSDWKKTAQAALKGGAQIIQLREKTLEAEEILRRARTLQELCAAANALFVVNDRVDVALASGASGVHLGQQDLAPQEAKRIAGEHYLVGRSTHSVEQAKKAVEQERADYIGIGAMYLTASKEKEKLLIRGPELARDVMKAELGVPIFAIGGITKARVKELREVGVNRIAVTTAVAGADDPEKAAAELRELLE